MSSRVQLLDAIQASTFRSIEKVSSDHLESLLDDAQASGLRVATLSNRRYLGNKYSISEFIRSIVDRECKDVDVVCDIFAGTGSVSNAFLDKTLLTNDILYSNYLANTAWFSPDPYRPALIIRVLTHLNGVKTNQVNYMRANFADTYFSAADCSKIGYARNFIQDLKRRCLLLDREFAILVTSLLYGMDRAANTVGHYDAYRQVAAFERSIDFPVILPPWPLPEGNRASNSDANELVSSIECDVLYLDPPYNSRQYSDAYHLLENVARWQKPPVVGVARKMDRSGLKSRYSTKEAAAALNDLVSQAKARYVLLSYNNMGNKGNDRSNAKISDSEILEILSAKGEVTVFQKPHKPFATGKSNIPDNAERLFLCKVRQPKRTKTAFVLSPINYIGGKGKLLPQIQPRLARADTFFDVFAGGWNVGLNAKARHVVFNDSDVRLTELLSLLARTPSQEVVKAIDAISVKYGLSNSTVSSYADYGTNGDKGLSDVNKAQYLRLRRDYNEAPEGSEKVLLLFALVIFGFNNQIRFNRSGQFNLPVGKRDFNEEMRAKLRFFYSRLQAIDYSVSTLDFREIDVLDTDSDTIFYCDPPYLITAATYNEGGRWAEQDEADLLSFLDRVSATGRKFALSNVLEAKGYRNELLSDWISSRSFKVHDLTANYANSSYRRKDRNSKTREVLITNY